MKKTTTTTTTKAVKAVAIKQAFVPVNAPKLNGIAISCNAIASIAAKGINDASLTKLGHIANCKGGVIDTVILSGKANTLNDFIIALTNSGLKNVNDDRQKYPFSIFQAVLAKRVVDHVNWCNQTTNDSHGGFGSRLAKTGLSAYRNEIAKHLETLANQLQAAFTVQFASLYRRRNK